MALRISRTPNLRSWPPERFSICPFWKQSQHATERRRPRRSGSCFENGPAERASPSLRRNRRDVRRILGRRSSEMPAMTPSALVRDFRHAVHVLRRSPAFTTTALITLALVIGANTAVFSLADEILIKPLPYPQPDGLAYVDVDVQTARGERAVESHDGTTWETLRDGATAIDVAITAGALFGENFGHDVNLSVDGAASSVGQERVSAGYFRVLGVAPFIGREFSADEDRAGGPAVAVVSYGLWQRLLQGDRNAVGKSVLLRGEPHEIVGVMPEGFRSLSRDVDVWTPVRPSRTGEGGGANYAFIARVGPGHTWSEALAVLPPLDAEYFRRLMGRNWAEAQPTGRFSLVPLQQALTAGAEKPLLTLVAAVGAVLLIACVNLAALLLSRARSRGKELATRMALGCGRSDVVRQVFVESLVLAVAGGVLGLLVGYVALAALGALGANTFAEWSGARLDVRALAVTAGLALATSLLFGLFPALQAGRLDLNAALAEGGARGVAGGARGGARRWLVGAEIALGVVLLVVTGLLLRTFVNLRTLEPGFDASHVATASVSLQDARYDSAAKMNRLFDESVRRIEAAPGIESAGVSLELPYRRLLNDGFAFADEEAPTGPRTVNVMYATPGFFATLRIPLRLGRMLGDTDTSSAPAVVVVSQAFVDLAANGENPVGRRIRIADAEREIVGIVGDVKVSGSGLHVPGMLEGPLTSGPLVYLPAAQTPDGYMRLHVWFSPAWTVRARNPRAAEAALREAIRSVDPLLPVGRVRPLADVRDDATATQQLLWCSWAYWRA